MVDKSALVTHDIPGHLSFTHTICGPSNAAEIPVPVQLCVGKTQQHITSAPSNGPDNAGEEVEDIIGDGIGLDDTGDDAGRRDNATNPRSQVRSTLTSIPSRQIYLSE